MAEVLYTKKTIAKLGQQMNNAAGSKPSKFALAQMKKMGWEEGQGLGKDSTGISKFISITKREDNIGLGSETKVVENVTENWWHDAFSSNLSSFHANLKTKIKTSKQKKSKDKIKKDKLNNDSSSTIAETIVIESAPTFDELFKATGGKRLGMRARAEQKGKIRRTEE